MFEYPLVARPAHVPPELVREFDLYNIKAKNAEWQLAVRDQIHAEGMPDIFWTPCNGGHWVPTRAPLIQEGLKDATRFSSRRITPIPDTNPSPPFVPLMIDPPDHAKYRSLIMPFLSPKEVQRLGEDARQLTISLIEGFYDKGQCEFIEDFATHLPIAIFMSIVDLPERDRLPLLAIANTLVRGMDLEKQAQAREDMAAYAMALINERRTNPGKDLISAAATARIDGELLSDNIMLGMVTLLLTAGLDTVASMLAFFTRFLADNPGHRRQLIDNPELIPDAVEEMLRRFPIANLGREVIEDTELGGAQLKAGDFVLFPTVAFGMDAKHFENADQVDFKRANKIHETFGDGAHRCMGSMLARAELRVFLEEWLKRIPDFRVKPGTELEVLNMGVAGINYLPLEWDVK